MGSSRTTSLVEVAQLNDKPELSAQAGKQKPLIVVKDLARNYELNEVTQALIVLFHFTENGVNGRTIGGDLFTARGVGEKLLCQATGELIVLLGHEIFEFTR
jgi:hypothetical protein